MIGSNQDASSSDSDLQALLKLIHCLRLNVIRPSRICPTLCADSTISGTRFLLVVTSDMCTRGGRRFHLLTFTDPPDRCLKYVDFFIFIFCYQSTHSCLGARCVCTREINVPDTAAVHVDI